MLYNAIFDKDGICYGVTNVQIKEHYKESISLGVEYKNIDEFLEDYTYVKILKIDSDYYDEIDVDACLIEDLNEDDERAITFINNKKGYKWEDGKLFYKNKDITDDLYIRVESK